MSNCNCTDHMSASILELLITLLKKEHKTNPANGDKCFCVNCVKSLISGFIEHVDSVPDHDIALVCSVKIQAVWRGCQARRILRQPYVCCECVDVSTGWIPYESEEYSSHDCCRLCTGAGGTLYKRDKFVKIELYS